MRVVVLHNSSLSGAYAVAALRGDEMAVVIAENLTASDVNNGFDLNTDFCSEPKILFALIRR